MLHSECKSESVNKNSKRKKLPKNSLRVILKSLKEKKKKKILQKKKNYKKKIPIGEKKNRVVCDNRVRDTESESENKKKTKC